MKNKRRIDFKSLGRALGLMVRGNIVRIIFVMIAVIGSAISSALGITFVEALVDREIPALTDAFNTPGYDLAFENFKLFIIKMAIVYGLAILFMIITNQLMIKVSQSTLYKLRFTMFNKMEYLPIKFFDQNKYGDIMSKYINDVDTLDNFITETVPNTFSSLISILSILIMMVLNNWILTILTITLLALILFSTKNILKRSAKHFMNRQKIVGESNGFVEETLEGARVVQVFNHQEKSIEEFKEISERYHQEDLKGNINSNVIGPLSGNLIRVQYIIVALLGAILVLNNVFGYTIGSLIAFLTLSNNFSNPIARMTEQISSLAQASAGSKRIFEMVDKEKEVDDGYVTLVNYKLVDGNITETDENTHKWAWKHPHHDGSVDYIPLKGDIVLENVDFRYDENRRQILFDINVYAKPGQRIAIVGKTGAGKTTITNLINRFYDIEDGKIRYDGININKIKKYDLRKSLGLVLQDTNLFTGTIKENIKLGRENATDEEVVEAAKIANADSFIRMMPNGYDTMLVRAGESLSEGQRQLIAIARAAIADCPVLILDEATSSIDTRTEKIVQDGMDKLMEGRTVFVIAHRLSTIEKSDLIMVMDDGRIIEKGTHEELINSKGVYYELYTGKFELE